MQVIIRLVKIGTFEASVRRLFFLQAPRSKNFLLRPRKAVLIPMKLRLERDSGQATSWTAFHTIRQGHHSDLLPNAALAVRLCRIREARMMARLGWPTMSPAALTLKHLSRV